MRIRHTHILLLTCLLASATVFSVLYFGQHESLKDSLSASAVVFTAFGLFMTAFALGETHRWNRYSYTLHMMEEWNNQVRSNLDDLDKAFPEFRQIPDNAKDNWKLDDARSIAIAGAKEDGDAALRNSLIRTLNFFEAMARGYELGSVDRETVQQSFGPMMLDVWIYFGPFINRLRLDMNREPWPPIARVCKLWIADELRRRAAENATKATRDYQDAQRHIDAKRPTGG